MAGYDVSGGSNGNDDPKTDPLLNGTWVRVLDDGTTSDKFGYTFDSGIFEYFFERIPFQKETYTTNNNKITIKPTHIY